MAIETSIHGYLASTLIVDEVPKFIEFHSREWDTSWDMWWHIPTKHWVCRAKILRKRRAKLRKQRKAK